MDTTNKEDSGNAHFEDISGTDQSLNRNEIRGFSDSVQEQSKPSSTSSSATKDIRGPVCKPCDKLSDVTISDSGSKIQKENRGSFGAFEDQIEQLTVEKQSRSTIQKQTESILDLRRGSTDSAKALDNDPRKSREVYALPRPLIPDNPKSPVRTEKIKNPKEKACITSCSFYEKNSDEEPSMNPEGSNPKTDQYEDEDNLKTGSEHLQLASAQIEWRSTGLEQSYDPNTKNLEDRDIFEAGGEESLNPRLKQPSEIFKTGEERIEYLPDEPPVPQVITSPTISTKSEILVSCMARLRLVKLQVKRCFKRMWKPLWKQFSKAPFFYLISFTVILLSAFVVIGKKADQDICFCLIIALVFSILITIFIEKGRWSKNIEAIGETSISSMFEDEPLGCACCRKPEPEIERHSQYNRLEEEMDITFEHEIADVSNIDPSDCPQMRMVEQHEILDPGSPDYPPDISQVNVDVHVPGFKGNEEYGAISKHHGQPVFKKSTITHLKTKSKTSSAPLKLPKSVTVDVQFPEIVVKSRSLSSSEPRLQAVASEFPELPQVINASKDKLKLFYDFSPQLKRIGNVETAEVDYDEFICEHTGQGLACSCSVNVPEKTDGSKNRVFAGKSTLQPKTDHYNVPKRTIETTGTEGDSSETKSGSSKLSQKKDSRKLKGKMKSLPNSPLKFPSNNDDEPDTSKHFKSSSSAELHK